MTEIILAVLLVASNLFWMLHTHKILNKLMSRTFYEYQDATLQPEKVKRKSNERPLEFDEPNYGALSEIMT